MYIVLYYIQICACKCMNLCMQTLHCTAWIACAYIHTHIWHMDNTCVINMYILCCAHVCVCAFDTHAYQMINTDEHWRTSIISHWTTHTHTCNHTHTHTTHQQLLREWAWYNIWAKFEVTAKSGGRPYLTFHPRQCFDHLQHLIPHSVSC